MNLNDAKGLPLPGRRWELLIFLDRHLWHWHVNRAVGKYKPFLWETWLGPFCFRVWRDPRSVSSVSKAVRVLGRINAIQ